MRGTWAVREGPAARHGADGNRRRGRREHGRRSEIRDPFAGLSGLPGTAALRPAPWASRVALPVAGGAAWAPRPGRAQGMRLGAPPPSRCAGLSCVLMGRATSRGGARAGVRRRCGLSVGGWRRYVSKWLAGFCRRGCLRPSAGWMVTRVSGGWWAVVAGVARRAAGGWRSWGSGGGLFQRGPTGVAGCGASRQRGCSKLWTRLSCLLGGWCRPLRKGVPRAASTRSVSPRRVWQRGRSSCSYVGTYGLAVGLYLSVCLFVCHK